MTNRFVEICLSEQTLNLYERDRVFLTFQVSTAANGPGEQMDSECTPRGRHVIDEKIGHGCAPNTVFVGRVATGEIYDEKLGRMHPRRDWILTRILWLRGLEDGRNNGGNVDTKARYIYIHGSPDSTAMGIPGSHGCIRLHNHDVTQLFDLVEVGTLVNVLD